MGSSLLDTDRGHHGRSILFGSASDLSDRSAHPGQHRQRTGQYPHDVAARRLAHLGVALVVFLGVTIGLVPAVNLVARLRSASEYDQYTMSGTWVVGALAATGYLYLAWLIGRMRRRRGNV